MRSAAAIALAVLYAGVTLAWGGVHPGGGPWRIFGPFIEMFGAGLLAEFVSSALPKPWSEGRRYESPPRRVHLSWRQVFRLPAFVPLFVLLQLFPLEPDPALRHRLGGVCHRRTGRSAIRHHGARAAV